MLSDQVLSAWLCFARFQFDRAGSEGVHIPPKVSDALEAKGWVVSNEQGGLDLTDTGRAQSEIQFPAWGVDPADEESA